MVSPDELDKKKEKNASMSVMDVISMSYNQVTQSSMRSSDDYRQSAAAKNGMPTLTLYNPSLDIRIVGINGAIIGRRQGPYQQLFEGNMFVSGVHAQLIFKPETGWCIIDKHSSNGTKLNQRDLLPDVPMSIKAGDIVTLANINLQVSVK
jgi:pSer/pThr/pTyr-binding forkhead associated (FHA) protein